MYISTFATPSDVISEFRDKAKPQYEISKEVLLIILNDAMNWSFPCGHIEKGRMISSDKEMYFIHNLFDQVNIIAGYEINRNNNELVIYDSGWTIYRKCEIITGMLLLIGVPYRLSIVPYHNSSTECTIKIDRFKITEKN